MITDAQRTPYLHILVKRKPRTKCICIISVSAYPSASHHKPFPLLSPGKHHDDLILKTDILPPPINVIIPSPTPAVRTPTPRASIPPLPPEAPRVTGRPAPPIAVLEAAALVRVPFARVARVAAAASLLAVVWLARCPRALAAAALVAGDVGVAWWGLGSSSVAAAIWAVAGRQGERMATLAWRRGEVSVAPVWSSSAIWRGRRSAVIVAGRALVVVNSWTIDARGAAVHRTAVASAVAVAP